MPHILLVCVLPAVESVPEFTESARVPCQPKGEKLPACVGMEKIPVAGSRTEQNVLIGAWRCPAYSRVGKALKLTGILLVAISINPELLQLIAERAETDTKLFRSPGFVVTRVSQGVFQHFLFDVFYIRVQRLIIRFRLAVRIGIMHTDMFQ